MSKEKKEIRTFACIKDGGEVVNMTVRLPTKREMEAADMEYSAQFNNALLHKLPTQASMLRRLRENEIIDPDVETEIGRLTVDTRALGKRIRDDKYASPDDKAADQKKLDETSTRLNSLTSEVDSFFEHTADTKASQSQRNFLIACVIEYADGAKANERVWNSVEDLMEETDGSIVSRVVYEYMMLANGMPSKWQDLIKAAEKPVADATPNVTPQPIIDAAVVAAPTPVAEQSIPAEVPAETAPDVAPAAEPLPV